MRVRFSGIFLTGVLLTAPLYCQAPKPWLAPAEAGLRSNPLQHKPELAGGGRKLFLRHCEQCHGPDALGRGHAANLRSPQVQMQPDGVLFWKMTNGNLPHGMPSFSGLPSLERWQLVLYLRKLNPGLAAATQ